MLDLGEIPRKVCDFLTVYLVMSHWYWMGHSGSIFSLKIRAYFVLFFKELLVEHTFAHN